MLNNGSFLGDRYEILERIGSGGMSDVYKAKCHKLSRFVAIKVLKEEFAEDKGFVTKFKTEAQSVAGLVHPNIVNVYDVCEENGMYYIVMEYIEGITLKQYVERKGRLAVKEAISIAIQIAQGMDVAHNNHIVHRDIKPQNVLISREGKVKVTDFGIARVASANTINANTVGSVHYISPEQARGGFVDEKSDIYSLGITLYEMVTGEVPFDGESAVSIALMHIQDDIVPANQLVPSLPISVERIIEKCTQKKPSRRYLKASALLSDLKRSLTMPNEDFVSLTPEEGEDETVYLGGEEQLDSRMYRDRTPKDPYRDDEFEEYDDDYYDEYEKRTTKHKGGSRRDNIIKILGVCVAAAVLIVLIVVCVGQFTGNKPGRQEGETTQISSGELRDVPYVVGLSIEEDDIEGIIKSAGFKVKFTYEESNDIEKGVVISQSEEAGGQAKAGTTISLVISSGGEDLIVPKIVGKTKKEAIAALDDMGLNYEVVPEFDEAPVDEVIKVNPAPGRQVKYGDTIEITISSGPKKDDNASVPSLKGLTQEQASARLSNAGLKLGNVTYKTTNKESEDGVVVYQGYSAGTTMPKNTAVDITIGQYEQEQTAASFSGYVTVNHEALIGGYISDMTSRQSITATIEVKTASGTVTIETETKSIAAGGNASDFSTSYDFSGLSSEPLSATVRYTVGGQEVVSGKASVNIY